LPFALLTNGGGILEHKRAEYVNQIVWGEKRNFRLTEEQMILCHTPLKNLKREYSDDYLLVSGMGEVLEIC
jgi:hypothetical protein